MSNIAIFLDLGASSIARSLIVLVSMGMLLAGATALTGA